MKRRLLKLSCLLLLGALVNVAVAWGASLLHQSIHHAHISAPPPPGWGTWARVEKTTMPARTKFSEEIREASLFEQFDAETATLDISSRYSAGWPYLSLSGEIRATPSGVQCISPSVAVGSPVPWLLLMEFRPIGFAINTLFYAGVSWMLFAGPPALRRMIRRRRGQCPACAYPIGQSPVCTECGLKVAQSHS